MRRPVGIKNTLLVVGKEGECRLSILSDAWFELKNDKKFLDEATGNGSIKILDFL